MVLWWKPEMGVYAMLKSGLEPKVTSFLQCNQRRLSTDIGEQAIWCRSTHFMIQCKYGLFDLTVHGDVQGLHWLGTSFNIVPTIE